MKTKARKMLPKTSQEIQNGRVYAQAVKCGKSNCRCSYGAAHEAFYFFTRRNGKFLKFYVRKSEVQRFSRLVEQAVAERKRQRRITQENMELLREFRLSLREKHSVINLIRET